MSKEPTKTVHKISEIFNNLGWDEFLFIPNS
jgi:hypothetical protein